MTHHPVRAGRIAQGCAPKVACACGAVCEGSTLLEAVDKFATHVLEATLDELGIKRTRKGER